MTRLDVSRALLPGYYTEPMEPDVITGELLRREVYNPAGVPVGVIAYHAREHRGGHTSYGWIRADLINDTPRAMVDTVLALPRVRWPNNEIDAYGRPLFSDNEIPPVDAEFAQWRGRTCADEPGKVVPTLPEEHRLAQLAGRCVGGWIASGDWWLHCARCRPDIAAIEREEYDARVRHLNPHSEART